METAYRYLMDGAQSYNGQPVVLWGYASNPWGTIKKAMSTWKGYPTVVTTVGPADGTQTRTKRLYYRGLDRDTGLDGGQDFFRHATIQDSVTGTPVDDRQALAGQVREEIVYNGPNEADAISKTIHDFVVTQTAGGTLPSWQTPPERIAYMSRETNVNMYVKRTADGSWRRSYQGYAWDPTYGSLTLSEDQGEVGPATDDLCNKYEYVRNTTPNLMLRAGTGTAAVTNAFDRQLVSVDWSAYDVVFSPGDFTGDGKPDVIARNPSNATLYLWVGNGAGGFSSGPTQIGIADWYPSNIDVIFSPGDFTGDGKADLIARQGNATLFLYPGNGDGTLNQAAVSQIGFGDWYHSNIDIIFSPGDFNGDGKSDVIARQADGTLFLYPGRGNGVLDQAAVSLISGGWGGYSQIMGSRDFTGDGKGDILAREAVSTQLRLFTGTGTGTVTGGYTNLGGGWLDQTQMMVPGDFTGDGKPDVLSRDNPAWITGTTKRVETVGVACSATPSYPADFVSDVRTFYDNNGYGVAPLRALPTRTETVKSLNGQNPSGFVVTTAGYDQYGRPVWAKDPLDHQTTTVYTHNTAGLVASTKVTNPALHDTTITVDTLRGLPLTVTDANNKVTTGAYDPLGRLVKVWQPGHPTTGTPDAEYVYTLSKTTASHVASKVLGPNGNQITSYEIFDGLLRPRQTQTITEDGKRTIVDTQYDARGLAAKTSTFYNNASAPASTLVTFADTAIDSQVRVEYDGAGRKTKDQLYKNNTFQWQTETIHGGDRVGVIPPTGGTPVQDLFDARGRLVEKRLHRSASSLSAAQVENSNSQHCLRPSTSEAGARVDPAVCDGSSGIDDWQLQPLADGFYRLRNVATSHCLVAPSWNNWTIIQSDCADWTDQRWQLVAAPGGYRLQHRDTGKCLIEAAWDQFHSRLFDCADYTDQSWVLPYNPARYSYDDADRLTQVVDPRGNTWTYEYDLLGRKTKTIDPDAGISTSTYDDAGQTLSTTDARAQSLFYEYDSLGRKTKQRDSTPTGTVMAEWVYDTYFKGQLASTIRRVGADAYTTRIAGRDEGYRPTHTEVQIPNPTLNGSLAATYAWDSTYKPNGAPATSVLPGVGRLPAETLTYTYDNNGYAQTLSGTWAGGGSQTYIADTFYTHDGLVSGQVLGTTGKRVKLEKSFDATTRRLTKQWLYTEQPDNPNNFVLPYDYTYGYDPAGNITSAETNVNATPDQKECFRYDYLRRLTEAWTQTSGACTTPQRSGADPYWRQWSFDTIGNRLTQTDKDPAAGDTSWSYTVGAAAGVKAHQVKTVTATGPKADTPTRAFGYDNAGNTTTAVTTTGASQTLTWDKEGHLATVAEGSATSSYLYDADGRRLIVRTPDKTTLYLPDGSELELPTGGGAALGTRYYADIAVRDAAGVKWTCTNHQNTSLVQIDSPTLTTSRRRFMPYGEDRTTTPTGWIGTKGYVGGTKDTTGYTHLGAREYDPTLGRFISVDPIMDLTDPRQWNAYSYANASPVTSSDPSGLKPQFDDLEDQQAWQATQKPQPSPPSNKCNGNMNSASCRSGGGGGPVLTIVGNHIIVGPSADELKAALDASWAATTHRLEDAGCMPKDMSAGGVCNYSVAYYWHGDAVCGAHPDWCTVYHNTYQPEQYDGAGGNVWPLLAAAGAAAILPELFHGTDLASANNIVRNGLDVNAARRLGGGDVFWISTTRGDAEFFAKANPSLSERWGVVGIRVQGGVEAWVRSGVLEPVPQLPGAYVVRNWTALNNIATFELVSSGRIK